MHPLPLLAAQDNAGITQNLHVVGQGGLTDAHFLQQVAGTLLPVSKEVQNTNPVFIAECFENQSGPSFVHGFTSH